MALDVGIIAGAQKLWEEKLFFDYTIVVENQEFQVHKVIMITVSEYFKVMLSSGMREGSQDRVTLHGQKASTVSKIIELIYTGHRKIMTDDPDEILGCALYLQIPAITEACRNFLIAKLSIENCLSVLSILIKYSQTKCIAQVKNFVKPKWNKIKNHYTPSTLTVELLLAMIECWSDSEYNLAVYIIDWINVDIDKRKVFTNDLMSQVRYCTMHLSEIQAIQKNESFVDLRGAWWEFVSATEKYLKLPVYERMMNTTEQTMMRYDARPVVFLTGQGLSASPYALHKDAVYALKVNNSWDNHIKKETDAPLIQPIKPIVLVLNNFLIVCSGHRDQRWFVFDPRTLTWHNLPAMPTAKSCFALVHMNNKLYAIGGHSVDTTNGIDTMSDTIEEFDLETGAWQSVAKLSFAVTKLSACVYNGMVYISGGVRDVHGLHTPSAEVYKTHPEKGITVKKPPLPVAIDGHQMNVMTLIGRKVMVIIDYDMNIYYIHPDDSQWTTFTPALTQMKPYYFQWDEQATMMVSCNTVYFLNVMGVDKDEDWDSDEETMPLVFKQVCLQWELSEEEYEVKETFLQRFPWRCELDQDGVELFGGLLSLTV